MKKKSFILNILYYVIPLVLVFPSSIWALYQMDKASLDCFFVVGTSMQPTLVGDKNNSTYGYSDNSEAAINGLERFDLVICYYPFGGSDDYEKPYKKGESQLTDKASLKVKRVIGLPGDTLHIQNEVFSITYSDTKGREKTDVYGGDHLKVPFERNSPIENRTADITLKDDEYFVMGDNWTKMGSVDCCNPSVGSRALPLYRENIAGVIVRLEGVCSYAELNHCSNCKKIVNDDVARCTCGNTKFIRYNDIVETRPYEQGPEYLK